MAIDSMSSHKETDTERKHVLVAGLLVAMLFASLDNTIIGTAMPRIVGDLGGLDLMAWLTTAYMLSSTSVVLVAGKLSDLFGRKPIYLIGMVIFILGSVLCGVAQSMNQLIWFRAFQGIGGGVLMPMAMIIIGDIFTGEQRAKWQGVFGGVFGLSSIIGPQVGGWIVDALNWRWVFYINLPVGFLAMFLISFGLRSQRVSGPIKIDFSGIVTMVSGVCCLLLGFSFGGKEYAWTSWEVLLLFLFSVVSFIGFWFIEGRAKEPILPLRLFKNKTFVLLSGIGFFMAIGMFGSILFVPLYMQGVVGLSASQSGTVMTSMMLSMIAASIVGGRLVRRIGVRTQILTGMAIMASGFWLLSTMTIDTSKWTAISHMSVLGLGLGLVMPTITLALQESFPKSELGVVTASSQFFRQIGGTFGMTILGVVMNVQSTRFLTDKLVPFLEHLPKGVDPLVNKLEGMIQHDPQGLYSFLLSSEAMQKIPASIQHSLVPILKTTFVSSLQVVFMSGVFIVMAGLLLAPFLGKISLTKEK